MVLIADSGSTKTHWSLCVANGQHSDFFTDGINPFYQSVEDIQSSVSNQLLPQVASYLWAGAVESIYFYGAGCAFPDKMEMITTALHASFPKAQVHVSSDLLAAARALLGEECGVACILGTGSNSCYYDGNEIVKNVSPLGFILGDEGSGAVLGRHLVADVLKNQLSEELREKFFAKYELTPAMILDRVYKQPFPNRFLASFTPFLRENMEDESVRALVYSSFDAFVKRNLLQYSVDDVAVSFVGSIAFYFEDVLRTVLDANGLRVGSIVKAPMDGLREFHKIKRYGI